MNDTNHLTKAAKRLADAKAYQVTATALYLLARDGDNIDEANDAFNEYEIANRAVFVLEAYYNAFAAGKTLAEAQVLAEEAIDDYENEE